MLNKVQELADSGRHAAVVDYLATRNTNELNKSPTLALLLGIAHARLGHHEEGERWVETASNRSRQVGDRHLEARALNVRGAIALASGRVDEAASYFMRALAQAKQDEDHATIGRCSNNLGIIANLRGEYGRAIGSYTMALAAFQQVGLLRGIAETHHNLRITYRDEGNLYRAFEAADEAVQAAERAGDEALFAQTLAGRAEIRQLAGEAKIAHREIDRALTLRRQLGDVIGEAEDLRVAGNIQAALGNIANAEVTLRDVIERAGSHERPLLAAEAARDLAQLLLDAKQVTEAREWAQTSRVHFKALGAEAEVRKLDTLLSPTRRS